MSSEDILTFLFIISIVRLYAMPIFIAKDVIQSTSNWNNTFNGNTTSYCFCDFLNSGVGLSDLLKGIQKSPDSIYYETVCTLYMDSNMHIFDYAITLIKNTINKEIEYNHAALLLKTYMYKDLHT